MSLAQDNGTFQGRKEVYFFIADPVFLPKFLIPDSKSDEKFDPWSCIRSWIPEDFLFIAPMGLYYSHNTEENRNTLLHISFMILKGRGSKVFNRILPE